MNEIKITNMHYYFYHDYYDFLDEVDEKGESKSLVHFLNENIPFEKKHEAITSYCYKDISSNWIKNNFNENYVQVLTGTVQYPGLLMGTGYTHALGAKGEIIIGFSFDYVTGLPYLPGSSLKGILKDKFQYGEYILENLKDTVEKNLIQKENMKNEEIDLIMNVLIKSIFGDENIPGKDVFMDSYIQPKESKNVLKIDYLAPHNQEMKSESEEKKKLFNVNVLTMLRVAPGAKINLNFILKDSVIEPVKKENGDVVLNGFNFTKELKLELFKQILTDFGIGAKTNVGYGNLVF